MVPTVLASWRSSLIAGMAGTLLRTLTLASSAVPARLLQNSKIHVVFLSSALWKPCWVAPAGRMTLLVITTGKDEVVVRDLRCVEKRI
jgi:phenolic acid decarboxylase